jgi:hypothetical protein
MSNIIINPYTFPIPPWSWTETFAVDTGFTQLGTTFVVDTAGTGQLGFANVLADGTNYLTKMFPDGNLSDTMWTMLGQETNLESGSASLAAAHYGASDANMNYKDNTAVSALTAFQGGCGTTGILRALVHYNGSGGTTQTTCYVGSRNVEYWDTLWRESATTMRYQVFSDGRARTVSVMNDAVTIASAITGLDRFQATGGDFGVPSRNLTGYVREITFNNEVNN